MTGLYLAGIVNPIKASKGATAMKNSKVIWSSEGLHLNADTCVDVKASGEGVVLGQLGETWLHDLHLAAAAARWLAKQLNQAADESELAR